MPGTYDTIFKIKNLHYHTSISKDIGGQIKIYQKLRNFCYKMQLSKSFIFGSVSWDFWNLHDFQK